MLVPVGAAWSEGLGNPLAVEQRLWLQMLS